MRTLVVVGLCGVGVSAVADTTKEVRDMTVQVADAVVTVRVTKYAGSPLVFCNMHDDENTAVEATERVIADTGGTLVELRHTGRRRVAFKSDAAAVSFDPNRIFTAAGVRMTLGSAAGFGAVEQVERFAKRLLDLYSVETADMVNAVHNNTDGGYSIRSYLPRQSEEAAAAEVFLDKDRDPDDFFLVTHRGLFEALKKRKFNVVLQDNRRAPDDGSLSVYCGRRGIPYANVEAEHGHKDQQVEMIRALVAAIGEVRPKREPPQP